MNIAITILCCFVGALAGLCLCKSLQLGDAKRKISKLEDDMYDHTQSINRLILEKAHYEEENIKLYAENHQLNKALKAALSAPDAISQQNDKESDVTAAGEENPLLPPADIPTNVFRCEPYMIFDCYNEADGAPMYKSAFAVNSDQYILQQECFTDPETGIRYWLDASTGSKWYCAALAGAYGTEIGHCYTFTLENGTVLPVVLADFKHDISDPRADDYGVPDINYDHEQCINIIEFVVDMKNIPEAAFDAGTMSALDMFGGLYGHGGNVVDVKDEGRRWKK